MNEADLSRANLSGTDLRKVGLHETKLIKTDMRKTDLRGAYLLGATYLRGTDLREANLSGAYLSEAYVLGANLSNADFTNVACTATIFADVDLSEIQGLGTVKHLGPSTIGVDTLYKSGGNIPEVFLRGCGVPDTMITFARSLVGSAIDFYSCFISYSHNDKSFARRLHDTLQGQGIRCWLDEKQMRPGDDIYEEIERGIKYWDKVLLCCSEHSLTSWWVDNEVDTAFQKERERFEGRQAKVLIPLDLDGYLFSEDYKGAKKQKLRSRLAADFKGWERDNAIFDPEIERVIDALKPDGGKEPPPVPKL